MKLPLGKPPQTIKGVSELQQRIKNVALSLGIIAVSMAAAFASGVLISDDDSDRPNPASSSVEIDSKIRAGDGGGCSARVDAELGDYDRIIIEGGDGTMVLRETWPMGKTTMIPSGGYLTAYGVVLDDEGGYADTLRRVQVTEDMCRVRELSDSTGQEDA